MPLASGYKFWLIPSRFGTWDSSRDFTDSYSIVLHLFLKWWWNWGWFCGFVRIPCTQTSWDAHVGASLFETVIAGTEWDPALFTKVLNDCRPKLPQTLNKSSTFSYTRNFMHRTQYCHCFGRTLRVLQFGLKKLSYSTGSKFEPLQGLKWTQIQSPHSSFRDLRADKIFAACWSGSRAQASPNFWLFSATVTAFGSDCQTTAEAWNWTQTWALLPDQQVVEVYLLQIP